MIYNICKDTPHFHSSEGPGWLNELGSWITKQLIQAYHQYGVNYKKVCTRLTVASDKAYQLLAHGRWFSPGTPASSTTKTGSHGIAEILLKVALKHQKSINPLKCLYQYRPLSDHVYVLRVSIMTFFCFPSGFDNYSDGVV